MPNINKKLSAFVVLLGFATLASASEYADQRLADAREMMQRGEARQAASSIEKALPTLIESRDFWTTSRAYFQLAVARGHRNENRAACAALSKSLDYYRRALVRDDLSLEYFGDMASDGSDGSDGM